LGGGKLNEVTVRKLGVKHGVKAEKEERNKIYKQGA
jgi:hypothetical protein